MFAFPAAKRPWGLAASLLCCLVLLSPAAPAAADGDQGYLGVMLQDLTPSMAKALQLGGRSGVIINDVVEASPAAKAGLQSGDVVLEIDGRKVADQGELTRAVRALEPGRTAKMLVLRDGREQTVKVELGKREPVGEDPRWLAAPDAEQLKEFKELGKLKDLEKFQWFEGREGKAPQIYFEGDGDGQRRILIRPDDDTRGWLGVHLDALNGQLGEYFGVKDGAGVLVTEVVEGSPAAAAGLQAGDVVVSAGDKEITTPDALHEVMAGTEPDQELTLQVLRKGDRRTITARLGTMPDDLRAGRRVEIIGDGEPGDLKVFPPRMLRHLGRAGDGDGDTEIIIERKHLDGESRDELRVEMEALRQELKQLREELKR